MCDKQPYNTRREAVQAARGIARSTNQSMRVYKCKDCGSWVLSSVKKKKLTKGSNKKLKYPFRYDYKKKENEPGN